IRLGDVAELNDMRFPHLVGLTDPGEYPTDVDFLTGFDARGVDGIGISAAHGVWGSVGLVGVRCPSSPLSAFHSARRRSSQACSTARTRPCNVPIPPYR